MSELELKYGKARKCTKCTKNLPLSSFGFACKSKLQLRGDCKECRNTNGKK